MPAPESASPARDPWAVYDRLLAGIPVGERVSRAQVGHWALIETASGRMGMAMTYEGGPAAPLADFDVVGRDLRDVAAQVRSWDLRLAALGLAAINAWYSTPERLAQHAPAARGPEAGMFTAQSEDHYRGQRVVVVGRFGGVDRFRSADFVVLERSPEGADLPDPACEFVLPEADLALLTATTLINKTAPRLLELAARARTVLIGPSTPLAPEAFAGEVQQLAGAVITDPERAWQLASVGARGRDMGECLEMYTLDLPA